MRGLPARRIASTALCAALLVGLAGPAAVAADPARERAHAASRAPLPDADALLAQVKSLGDLGGVLTPATDLLNAVLKADNGQLPAADAAELGTAVKDAIAKVTGTAAATPATTLPALPGLTRSGSAPADVIGDALAALQKAIDELIKAVTSGEAAQVTPAVTTTVTSLVNTVAATLLGGKLPAPSLPSPPSPPALPTGGISYEDS
ncbi:hypothetical protein M2164_005444 [Streptomyces sp. SAI-208]|uniref:hypothetical protein n=1 Tax=Streptomyces sp. SAI-208 TaxID=2940550 RepID=UPI0024749C7D|nr:hypothetical protein [Streptomyces sp. SAI-208]MDH6609809.1 hypothetical protein [Streptomyces sp. SAI-208]